MGRPPCCDKTGVKKGPWTPEEDIILVSYIQEHGPGNWRSVTLNTGLLRCSKSCRLRWTNYLRPGIKRGNFTEQEEKMIIHLQALFGNRWAAIASYLPQRTDNDIKNYWNTHLKKKLSKQLLHQGWSGLLPSSSAVTTAKGCVDGDHNRCSSDSGSGGDLSSSPSQETIVSRGQWERRLQTDIHMAKKALQDALSLDDNGGNGNNILPTIITTATSSSNSSPFSSSTTTNVCTFTKPAQSSCGGYAYSADNIARLLQGWMKNSPDKEKSMVKKEDDVNTDDHQPQQHQQVAHKKQFYDGSVGGGDQFPTINHNTHDYDELMYGFGFESFESSNNNSDLSPSLSPFQGDSKPSPRDELGSGGYQDDKDTVGGKSALSLLEKWLFDDQSSAQGLGGDGNEELTNYMSY